MRSISKKWWNVSKSVSPWKRTYDYFCEFFIRVTDGEIESPEHHECRNTHEPFQNPSLLYFCFLSSISSSISSSSSSSSIIIDRHHHHHHHHRSSIIIVVIDRHLNHHQSSSSKSSIIIDHSFINHHRSFIYIIPSSPLLLSNVLTQQSKSISHLYTQSKYERRGEKWRREERCNHKSHTMHHDT